MTTGREPSLPPSDPHGLGRSIADLPRESDRSLYVLRVRAGVALVAGVVVIGGGLFLWRRPHAPQELAGNEDGTGASSALAAELSPPAPPQSQPPPSRVALSDVRVLGCHDRGPRVTSPDQCDHLAPLDKAFSAAIEQAAACVPPATAASAAGVSSGATGTIEYVLDVSFLHDRLAVSLPHEGHEGHEGRSVRDRKTLHACATAVRTAMQLTSLAGVQHQHAQYKLSVTATYRTALQGGVGTDGG